MLSEYPKEILYLWFGDDSDKIKEFGDYLLKSEEKLSESNIDDLLSDKSHYERKLEKLEQHKCTSMIDIIVTGRKRAKLIYNIATDKKYKKMYNKKDLGIATYLNSDRYKKKMLNKTKYRKELKRLAKRERREVAEMRQLGYIRSKDPDKELNKLLKANKMMEHALSDAYTQKHFVE